MIHGSLDFVRSEEGHPAILSASDIVMRASAASVEEEEEELRLLLSDDIGWALGRVGDARSRSRAGLRGAVAAASS